MAYYTYNGCLQYGSVPFADAVIGHRQSQRPVPKVFPLFTRCEWLVVNRNVAKRAPLLQYATLYLFLF